MIIYRDKFPERLFVSAEHRAQLVEATRQREKAIEARQERATSLIVQAVNSLGRKPDEVHSLCKQAETMTSPQFVNGAFVTGAVLRALGFGF